MQFLGCYRGCRVHSCNIDSLLSPSFSYKIVFKLVFHSKKLDEIPEKLAKTRTYLATLNDLIMWDFQLLNESWAIGLKDGLNNKPPSER